jgi:hypothetical protein
MTKSQPELDPLHRTPPPAEVGGIPVVAFCLPEDYRRLSDNDGMWGSAGAFQPFDSLAVCRDEDSGGVFVFKCVGSWSVLADEWYETREKALDVLEHQYPGIHRVLVTRS